MQGQWGISDLYVTSLPVQLPVSSAGRNEFHGGLLAESSGSFHLGNMAARISRAIRCGRPTPALQRTTTANFSEGTSMSVVATPGIPPVCETTR